MTLRSFNQALSKGELGETVVRTLLESKGWVVYQPITEGPHHFDMLSIKEKKQAIAIDVKTKARMNKLRATGIDERHFYEYQRFSQKHNMPFWLIFVDEHPEEQRIYGNTLDRLETPYVSEKENRLYPYTMAGHSKIRLWSLDTMVPLAPLDGEFCQQLIALSQRSYGYSA